MKSLQVLTPHQECIFNCPFCIAKTHDHHNSFKNNYQENHAVWKSNLEKIIKENKDLKYVIITGTNEPMQSEECVKEIIDIVRTNRNDIQIEIQTRFYKKSEIYKTLDVVAYSISDFSLLSKIQVGGKINRYVLLLTKTFNEKRLDEILDVVPEDVEQITFKVLHDSNGFNKRIDEWIDNNKTDHETVNKLIQDIENYKGNKSIRFDANSMDAENRYMVFREDGLLYKDWNDKEGI